MTDSPGRESSPAPSDSDTGVVTTAWVAIWSGAAALALTVVGAMTWLTGWVGALWLVSALAVVAAIASWGTALVAALIALSRVLRGRAGAGARRALRMAGPGALAGSVVIGVAVVLAVQTSGVLQSNEAQRRAEPAISAYRDAGARVVCDNGDSGHGVVNRYPWYDVWLEVPVESATERRAEGALAAVGFTTAERSDVGGFSGEAVPTGSFAMVAGDDVENAVVSTYGPGPVAFRCDGPGYGDSRTAGEGAVFVVVSVRLPDVG
ncbi:MAG: hypothetical protein ABWZ77_02690 [Naasia sp.]